MPKIKCTICRLPKPLCLCPLTKLANKTQVTLVMTHKENQRPTNTGMLAYHSLQNAQVRLHGSKEHSFELNPGPHSVLLFPSENAQPLDSLNPGTVISQLFVIDATWPEAKRLSRHKHLCNLPRVCLSEDRAKGRFKLRVNAPEDSLSTIEAIAFALGYLENATLQLELEKRFQTMQERLLWLRGQYSREQLKTPIPQNLKRHEL